MMLWDVALKNLWRRRLRSVLTILAVAVALQLYLTLNGLMDMFEQDVQRQFNTFAGKVFVQQALPGGSGWESFPSLSSSIDAERASTLLGLDHVDRAVSGSVLFVQLVAAVIPSYPPEVMIVGIEPGHEGAFLDGIEVEVGEAMLADAHSVILGQGAARYYGPAGSETPAQPGQTVEIQGEPFTVAGVLESAPLLFNGAVLMPLSTAQDLLERPATVSAVILTATSVEDVESLRTTVMAQFPGLQASSQDELVARSRQMVVLMGAFFGATNKTVLGVVVIVVAIVMIVAVMEQRREIGTLRAIGARRLMILSLVVSESLTLSLIGAVASLPLAAATSWVFWRWPLPADIIMVWGRILGVAIILGVLASLLPAWRAVRVDPLEALKYE